jgi:high-affinity iron transporter
MANVFAVQIFFIVFRECLEATVIISVLLAFLKQSLGQPDQDQELHKRLRRQVWLGSISGIVICLIIGGAFIGVFYGLGRDIWSQSEDLWEGIFYLIATIIISIMGFALLRINKMKDKWKIKIADALLSRQKTDSTESRISRWSKKYVMFVLPFITTMREGVEAVVFVGGVSLSLPATAFPLPVVCGLIAGITVGYLIYRGGNSLSLNIFMIISTCFLYLIAAGMFSKSIWGLQYYVFQNKVGSDVAEAGNGPGSYDILESVWHVPCCNPEESGGYEIFNALLGWENSATYGSVISYCVYWIFVIITVICMLFSEKYGYIPIITPLINLMEKIPVIGPLIHKKRSKKDVNADEVFQNATNVLVKTHAAPGDVESYQVGEEGSTGGSDLAKKDVSVEVNAPTDEVELERLDGEKSSR